MVLIPFGVNAQQACSLQLSGRVLDEHDRSPLAFAEIRVIGKEAGTVAAEDGRFMLADLCPGEVRLRISHLGCTPMERTILLPRQGELILVLEHHAHELREFEVARARPDELVGQAHFKLGKEAMERSLGAGLGDLVGTMPGASIVNSGPTIAKPVIHGLSGNRILTLNQGVRQEDQQWGAEHAPSVDPFSTDRITVIKGAAGVQYGSDAMGGVVIVEPVELPRDTGISGGIALLGSYNGRGGGMQAHVQGGVPGWKGFGWRLQGGGRYLGDQQAPDHVLSNTGLHEGAGSASIGFRDHARSVTIYYSYFQRRTGILRAAHIGNLTDLRNAIALGRPWYEEVLTYAIQAPQQTAAHQLLKVEGGVALAGRSRLVCTYGYQANTRQEFDRRRGGRDAIPALDLDLRTHTADLVLKHWLGRSVHGRIGAGLLRQTNVNIAGTGVRPLIPNYLRESAGIFIVEHVPVSGGLELEVGARSEASRLFIARYDADDVLVRPEHAFVNHAFSAGLNWDIGDSTRLRFNLGTAYRPPHVSELYSEGLHHGAAAIEIGDDRLGSERSAQASLDLRTVSQDGRLTVEATAYMHWFSDLIYLRPDGYFLTIRGAFPGFRYVATDARFIGSEASVHYRPHPRWSISTAAATVRARDLVQDEWLFQMPSDRISVSVMKTLADGETGHAEVAVTGGYVAQQRRIPQGLDFMDAPDAYALLGLTMEVSRSFDRGVLRFGCTASNILDQRYRDLMDRFRYYTDARGLGVDLRVRYEFGRSRMPGMHP